MLIIEVRWEDAMKPCEINNRRNHINKAPENKLNWVITLFLYINFI